MVSKSARIICISGTNVSIAMSTSVAAPSYDKGAALAQDKQKGVRLQRLGEVVLQREEWVANDEQVSNVLHVFAFVSIDLNVLLLQQASPRQVRDVAALFHFRHWDDYVASSQAVTWPADSDGVNSCMVCAFAMHSLHCCAMTWVAMRAGAVSTR
jgi:hypothetical protein